MRQLEVTRVFYKHLSVELIIEFKDSYITLIYELDQIEQGILEKVKNYTDRVQGLSVRITQSLRAQGHNVKNPIFEGIKILVVKHFMIELLLELFQQVKYEDINTLEVVIHIIEKKETNLESTPIISLEDTMKVNAMSLGASSSKVRFSHPTRLREWK